jgi:hypothetical protein
LRVRTVFGPAAVVEGLGAASFGVGAAAGFSGVGAPALADARTLGLAAFDGFGAGTESDGGIGAEGSPAAPVCAPASAALAALRRRRGVAAAGVTGAALLRGVDGIAAVGGAASAGGVGEFLRRTISGQRAP